MLPQAEIRCYCSRQPLLGLYGVDEQGFLYVHVKAYKAGKVHGEVIVSGDGATAKIRCRECMRWFSVVIHASKSPELSEIKDPTIGLREPAAVNGCPPRGPLRKVTPR